MKNKTFLLVLFAAFSLTMSAQITGTVLEASTDFPVIGASVVEVGTTNGVITDFDGNFVLNVAEGAQIQISYVGFQAKTLKAMDGMVVKLEEDTYVLQEVVAIGYGSQTKKEITGSVSSVKAEDFNQGVAANPMGLIQGKVAGLTIIKNGGDDPAQNNYQVQLRGVGSLSGSASPLYVIDGVPGGDLSSVLPSDIESIDVLKDGSAAAIYGTRANAGVILITTKRGSTRDAKITVEGKWGNNQRALPNYNVMTDPAMYYEKFYEAMYMSQLSKGSQYAHDYANRNLLDNDNGGLGYLVYTIPEGERFIGTNGKLNPNAVLGYNDGEHFYTPDNWFDELFKTNNLRQEYNLNISGSSDKFNYYGSFSYLDDSGLMENSDYSRFTARVAVDYQAKKWLKFSTNMAYAHSDQHYPDDQTNSGSSGNLFYVSNFMAPIYPLYIRDAEGKIMVDHNGYTMYDYGDATEANFVRAFMNQSNPASAIALNKSLLKNDMFSGNFTAAAELYDGLKATAKVAVGYVGVRYQSTLNPYYGQFANMGGQAQVEADRMFTLNQQYLLTYEKEFGAHGVDILAGYESYQYTSSYVYGVQTKLFNPDMAEVSNAILQPNTGSATSSYATQGILAQAKYDYDNKYYVSASYRRDGSSRFAPGRRWGNFWSVGAAWDIKSEAFMDAVDKVNLLKLKFSYGVQGNDDLNAGGFYPYADQYALSENNGTFAATLSYKGNEEITWETSHNLNAGVDFSFFDERLNGTIEGYWRRTEDMLYYKPVRPSLGYSTLPINIGSLSNAGVELEISGDVVKTKNVTWSIYANVSYNKNKILELDPTLGGEWISGSTIFREGENINQFYIREYAGVNPETGAAQWYIDEEVVVKDEATGEPVLDKEGKPVTEIQKNTTESWSDATQYAQGDLLPKVYGGFGTSLNAYGFDVSVAFNYQLGGKLYDYTYAALMHSGYMRAGQNWHVDILKSWTPENTETDVPRVSTADQYTTQISDRFLVSSNYLSLQNITLGYTLPSKWTKKLHIEKLRVYAVADNVSLWAARQGLDPRQAYGMSAETSSVYSPIRSVSGGISITF